MQPFGINSYRWHEPVVYQYDVLLLPDAATGTDFLNQLYDMQHQQTPGDHHFQQPRHRVPPIQYLGQVQIKLQEAAAARPERLELQ